MCRKTFVCISNSNVSGGIRVVPETSRFYSDGILYTAEGYLTLGKITATAVQDYYRAKR